MKEFNILYPAVEGSESQNKGYLILKQVFKIMGVSYKTKAFGTLFNHINEDYYPCVVMYEDHEMITEFDLSQIHMLMMWLKDTV